MASGHNQQPGNILDILWLAMELSPLFIGFAIIAMHVLEINDPINPALSMYLVIAGFLAIPAVVFFSGHYRNTERKIKHEVEFENADAQQKMQQLTALMIIGMAIAEFPACMSLSVYVVSGEMTWAIILLVVSLLLGFKFRPDKSR